MNIMSRVLYALALSGLMLTAAGDAHAAGQGRGDHDRSTGQWNSGIGRERSQPRNCRSDDGRVVCRDARSSWRHQYDDWWFDGDCRGDDDWPCGRRQILPRNVVIDWLNDWDFRGLRDLKLRDSVYTVKAVDPYGRRVRLTVDATSGRILRSDPR